VFFKVAGRSEQRSGCKIFVEMAYTWERLVKTVMLKHDVQCFSVAVANQNDCRLKFPFMLCYWIKMILVICMKNSWFIFLYARRSCDILC